MDRCYLCLETTRERSPVREAHLHHACMQKLRTDTCSICKDTFETPLDDFFYLFMVMSVILCSTSILMYGCS